MTLFHAWVCLMFLLGCCSVAYFIGSFLNFHRHHRRVARRRWPSEQHRSFFTDCKRFPEDDWT